jgi:hypothetical protein
MFVARPGYRSDTETKASEAYVMVEERGHEYALVQTFGEWIVRYLRDTHEVVLIKRVEGQDDEAVYTEMLDQ